MSRVLITGVTGFIGTNLARYMLARGHEVHGTTSVVQERTNLPQGLRLHYADVRNAGGVQDMLEFVRPDFVFHCAALGGVRATRESPALFDVNVIGTKNLLDAAYNVGVKVFIHAGSSSEYGRENDGHLEQVVAHPTTPYGLSKLLATNYVTYYGSTQVKMRCHTLRIFNAYGPYEGADRFVASVVRGALSGALPPLNNPFSVRDFIYVEDVCAAFDKMAHGSGSIHPIVNLGRGTQMSLSMAVDRIRYLTGCTDTPQWNQEAPCDSTHWRAEVRRLSDDVRVYPRTFDNGVSNYISWLYQNDR